MFRQLGRNNRLLMLALFVWALGEGLWYINFRQLYLAQLGATSTQVGLALAIEMFVRALLPIPAGILADRIGSHRVMVASWFVGVLGTLVGALATTWQMFIPGLAIYAISAFAMPSLSAYAIQNVPDRTEPGAADRVLAAVFAAYTAGLIVSPALGGLIADQWSIRASLWISTVIFALSTAIIMLTTAPQPEDEDPADVAERPAALLRNPRFLWLSAYCALVFLALYTGHQLMPNFLQDVRGLSMARIGFLFSIAAGGTVVLNAAAGRISPRWNFAAALAVYGLALLGVWLARQPVILSMAFFAAGGISVLRTLALARTAGVVSPRNQGFAFGIVETIHSISAAFAAGLAGRLYELTPAHDLPLVVALASVPLLLGLWLAVRAQLSAGADRAKLGTVAADQLPG